MIFSRKTIYHYLLIVSSTVKKKDRINIIRLILEVSNEANDPKKMTRIIYRVLVNHHQLKEYWTVLTERDLLIYDGDTQTFQTTEKGLKFLKAYDETGKLIKRPTPAPQEQRPQL